MTSRWTSARANVLVLYCRGALLHVRHGLTGHRPTSRRLCQRDVSARISGLAEVTELLSARHQRDAKADRCGELRDASGLCHVMEHADGGAQRTSRCCLHHQDVPRQVTEFGDHERDHDEREHPSRGPVTGSSTVSEYRGGCRADRHSFRREVRRKEVHVGEGEWIQASKEQTGGQRRGSGRRECGQPPRDPCEPDEREGPSEKRRKSGGTLFCREDGSQAARSSAPDGHRSRRHLRP